MSEEHLTDERLSQLTREFIGSEFYRLVFEPKYESEIARVDDLIRRAAIDNNRDGVFGWTWYKVALQDICNNWVGAARDADKLPDLSTGDYTPPRYPKVEGEE